MPDNLLLFSSVDLFMYLISLFSFPECSPFFATIYIFITFLRSFFLYALVFGFMVPSFAPQCMCLSKKWLWYLISFDFQELKFRVKLGYTSIMYSITIDL